MGKVWLYLFLVSAALNAILAFLYWNQLGVVQASESALDHLKNTSFTTNTGANASIHVFNHDSDISIPLASFATLRLFRADLDTLVVTELGTQSVYASDVDGSQTAAEFLLAKYGFTALATTVVVTMQF